eukprot:m.18509 g.18509  ORF g.18509 m.18509 type:complete len:425 (-) comp10822_c0_seq1:27-1301(-)
MMVVTGFQALVLATILAVASAEKWAVLVAGSNTFSNYRHQADVCHAYHVLIEHGFQPEHIIVMMYDDIANNKENPTPGVIINHPNGPNVYDGVKIDYRQTDVSPENFLNIIEGNAAAMKGVGTGRVLQSTAEDHVFINFVDHGGPQVIAFPQELLNSSRLHQAFTTMHAKKMYKQMMFYLESCESGSMFQNDLVGSLNIFATTAADATQSSFACYFDQALNTYLGDLYSVNWMQNSDSANLHTETVEEQYKLVALKTNVSKVCKFGKEAISKEVLASFQAGPNNTTRKHQARAPSPRDLIDSRDVDEDLLRRKLQSTSPGAARDSHAAALATHLALKARVKRTVTSVVNLTVVDPTQRELHLTRTVAASTPAARQCVEATMAALHTNCLNLGQNSWAFKWTRPLVSLCESGVASSAILASINTC